MSFAQLFSFNESIWNRVRRRFQRKAVCRSSQFMMESLESRLLLSATPDVVGLTAVTWDMDGNGQQVAASDGVLISRYLSGLRGEALTAGVVDPTGTRSDPGLLTTYLNDIAAKAFDVDGNNQLEVSRDGVLISRYLSGLTGNAPGGGSGGPVRVPHDP